MKDAEQIFNETQRTFDELRALALDRQLDRLTKIKETLPEYAELEKEYTACGAKMARLAIKGMIESDEYKKALAALGENEKKKKNVLSSAGYDENYLKPEFRCNKCEDTGIIKDENGNEVRCECFGKVFGEIALRESNLPVKEGFSAFSTDVYSDEDKEKAKRRIDELKVVVRDFPKGANRLILGKTGVGKTFSASMTGAELARKGICVLYVALPEMMRTLLYYGENEELNYEKEKMRKMIKDVGFLILDELGAEKMSDAKRDILTCLIDERLTDKTKGTFVITNNSLREILANYGERIFSRFTTMTIDNVELSDGKDIRQKIKTM